ncbi:MULTISPECIES: ABC transporter permease [Pandoraea]|uniref:Peptide ABC transporter permease n=2 Tax=Pandoraea TaxID=93217 RepID=A0A5E4UFQ3_9BURK|nr:MULTISPECIES: ABC transporter permease [Pandoraea]ALS62729.1 peptide ABC transporter permease [Pandoraea norimbergensis]VVD97694.1 peptide ABC transporter permease [Pandoraea iniqua]
MTYLFSLLSVRRANLWIGGFLVGLLVLIAAVDLVYTPYNPVDVDLYARYAAPSAAHWFGTDAFGRDVLSRIMAGASLSLMVSVASVVLALAAGTLIGAIFGYVGGWPDRLAGMLVDALMAFPGLLLALGIMTVLGPSKWGVVLALGLAYTPSVSRIARGAVLSLRMRDYVEASRTMGNREAWTFVRHVLPHCVQPLLIFSTSLFGSALLAESALSFLGLGVPAPEPTWGGMLADGRSAIDQAFWVVLFPGAAISLALFGINLLGDAVRDLLDPRLKEVK